MANAVSTPDPAPTRAGDRDAVTPSWWRSALAGVLAAAVALGIGELVAGLSERFSPPVIAVGNRVIDAVPQPIKQFAIDTFGTNDKIALLAGIYSFAAVFGLLLGYLAAKRFVIGAVGIAVFGAVGVWAASSEFEAPWWAGVPSVIGAVVGIAALAALLATVAGASRPALADPVARAADTDRRRADGSSGQSGAGALARRSFLKVSAGVVVAGAAAAGAGRWLQGRFSAAASRAEVTLPGARTPAEPIADGVALDIDGISPYLTSNEDFYRIDINLQVPQVPIEGYQLTVKGMVDQELTLSYEELRDRELVEERITMTCVSNEVGGDLVDNALWLGTSLKDLLDEAGIQEGADQIVGRAVDGFTTGFPVSTLDDGRPALVAVGMNGEPLPLEHGFPVRLIVPGLYGYVSATKWLVEIEITTFADFDQYWVERDWAAEGPIKTQARIDTPKGLQRIPPGPTAIAGVAWAQTRGIETVEVQIDDGDWQEATLAGEDNMVTWRQWMFEWDATPGRHNVVARATDGTGEVQTEERARPFPNGASGWHSVAMLVDDN
jgi:DMSO/TMAO reductase YedYZ molybdopterin-dependent catalytic subunit